MCIGNELVNPTPKWYLFKVIMVKKERCGGKGSLTSNYSRTNICTMVD